MKNYTYLSWLIRGTAFLFLFAQPSQAATEIKSVFDETDGKNQLGFKEIKAVNIKTEDLSFSDVDNKTFSVEQAIKIATPSQIAQAYSSPPMIPNPNITIQDSKGNPFETPTTNAPNYDTPVLPRAVAPPVGDIAVSNIDANSPKVKFNTGSVVIPRVLLREASVREVLMTLANYAGYNVVYIDGQSSQSGQTDQNQPQALQTISLEFNNESVEDIFNSILMISGYQANVQGRTIFVGARLPQSARNLISRSLRLNQVKADDAASFLASQGAEYQRVFIQIQDVLNKDGNIVARNTLPPTLVALKPERSENLVAPILLTGLTAAVDERTNSITLIGEPRLVQVATSLLVQLDVRRRQVVVNVKIIDINLLNTDDFNSSFSFGFNDGYFLQDGGAAVLNFGGVNPPSRADVTGGAFSRPVIPLLNTIVGGAATLAPFFDIQNSPFNNIPRGYNEFTNSLSPYARPNFGTNRNPFQPGVSDVNIDPATGLIEYEYQLPGLFQYPQKFLLSLEAQITSGNAKILTDPSIVVQEGQKATISVTEQVVGSVKTEVDPLSGVRTTTPVLADAGLILDVDLNRVDDNGFISLSVNPTIAAPGSTVDFDSGDGAVNRITLLNSRQLNSGLIRLRDGQTLILSGIIQETDKTSEKKVPILGDIPILGALFRSRSNQVGRNEVIIIMTPKILDDNADSAFGYNYQPGKDAAEILKRQGFPIQPLP